jgi:hypothetical protein
MDKYTISEEIRDPETYQLIEPRVIECRCGKPIALWSSWANACEKCGVEFNGSGQMLAPRCFWGEETGEVF